MPTKNNAVKAASKLDRKQLTPEEFSALVRVMLQEYIEKQYGADVVVGQPDLMATSMSFFEAMFILVENGFELRD